jgi:hypothetical protein
LGITSGGFVSTHYWQHVPKVEGQGTYRWFLPKPVHPRKSPRHFFFQHNKPPECQNSLVVYPDGSVVEMNYVPLEVQDAAHFILRGGYIWPCADLDDLTKQAIQSAGYSCCVPGGLDVFTGPDDRYAQNPDEYDEPERCG